MNGSNASVELWETAQELREIKAEIMALVDQARRLVRPTSESARARAYWLSHLESALKTGGAAISMQDSIYALEEESKEMRDEEMERWAEAGA